MESIANFFGFNNSGKRSNSSSSTTTSTHNNQQQDDYSRRMQDCVVVSYQDRYYDIHFRDLRGGVNQATVAELKERCKRVTGVTIATMKLKVSGAFVKDDTATLPSSGIHAGSLVLLMGERANTEQVRQTASGNPEEVGYMIRISKVMDKIDGSKAKIEQFDIMVVAALEAQQQSYLPPIDETKKKETEDLGIYLSELLMQALITLDGVECPSEFETARANRRQGVKICQELMDRVDQSRAVLKQAYVNKL